MTVIGRDTFVDPATGETYVWANNHTEEDAVERTRHLEELEPTAAAWQAGVRPVRQQGTQTPLVTRLTGRALVESQHAAFVHWFQKCISQTIFFYHCDGPHYEVQITRYSPQRKSAVKPKYVNDYTLEMEILREL